MENEKSKHQSLEEITYETLFKQWIKNIQNSTNSTGNASHISMANKFNELLRAVNPDNYPELRREKLIKNILVIVFYSLIIIVSLFGNLLVCKVILSKRCMRFRTTNIIIVNLTISDLLMTIFTIPVTAVRLILDDWPFGTAICIIAPFIQVTTVYVSTLSMAIIALDRYQVLVHPFRPRLCNRIPKPVIICMVWITAGLLSIPHAVFNRSKEMFSYKTIYRCRTQYPEPKDLFRKSLTAFTFLTQYLIPLAITILTYAIICVKIFKRVCIGEMTAQQLSTHIRGKKRTIKMLVLVVVVFAVCWLPINTYWIINDFYSINLSLNTYYLVHWLAFSSVMYNPFIYFWLNKYYRNGFKSMFFRRKINFHRNRETAYHSNRTICSRISAKVPTVRSDLGSVSTKTMINTNQNQNVEYNNINTKTNQSLKSVKTNSEKIPLHITESNL